MLKDFVPPNECKGIIDKADLYSAKFYVEKNKQPIFVPWKKIMSLNQP